MNLSILESVMTADPKAIDPRCHTIPLNIDFLIGFLAEISCAGEKYQMQLDEATMN